MSLNGLDNVEVTQAYQGALAEAGGWYDSLAASRLLVCARNLLTFGGLGSC